MIAGGLPQPGPAPQLIPPLKIKLAVKAKPLKTNRHKTAMLAETARIFRQRGFNRLETSVQERHVDLAIFYPIAWRQQSRNRFTITPPKLCHSLESGTVIQPTASHGFIVPGSLPVLRTERFALTD